MSLHDRIMALPIFNEGAFATKRKAADMATEADELMADCEAVLSQVVKEHGSMRAFHMLEKIRKYNAYKESAK